MGGGETARQTLNWRERAACRGATQVMFNQNTGRGNYRGVYTEAQQVCGGCPVRLECRREYLAMELHRDELFSMGCVVGGMTPYDLRKARSRMRNAGMPETGDVVQHPKGEPLFVVRVEAIAEDGSEGRGVKLAGQDTWVAWPDWWAEGWRVLVR